MGRETLATHDSRGREHRPVDRGRESGGQVSSAPRASVRYSRFVGAMKLLLPAVAAALIGLVIVWPQMQPGSTPLRLGVAAVAPADTENPRMVNARFTGTDGVDRPFTVTAEAATQLGPDSALVGLERPQADLTIADGSWVVLTSLTGTYNQETNDLELRDEVNLFHDAGYEFHTTSAHIDFRSGNAYGKAPVQGQGPFGLLNSEGFRVLDRGKTVIFTGPARLVIHPRPVRPKR